jgi:uncharacterized membrane protein YozB (DUF420 family)
MGVSVVNAIVNNPAWNIRRLILLLTLGVLAGLVLWFINHSVLPYRSYNAGSYGDFWPRRYGLILHIASGVVSVLLGLVQLWLGATGQLRRLHRMAGKTYVVAVAIGSMAAVYLALTSTGPLGYWTGLLGLSVAWALTTAMGYIAARRRNYQEHKEWMIRSYVVTFAFVTFRLSTRLILSWWALVPQSQASQVMALMAWACWAVPLLLLDPFLHRTKLKQQARIPGSAA